MPRKPIFSVQQAQAAFDASERLVAKGEQILASRKARHERNTMALHNTMVAHRPLKASDMRLRVVLDESVCFTSERHMLDEVFGATWCESCAGNGGCEPNEEAQRYIDAWHNGNGVFSYGAILEVRNRASGLWQEHDSCFGFYGLDSDPDRATLDSMVEQLLPAGVLKSNDIEIVYGDASYD